MARTAGIPLVELFDIADTVNSVLPQSVSDFIERLVVVGHAAYSSDGAIVHTGALQSIATAIEEIPTDAIRRAMPATYSATVRASVMVMSSGDSVGRLVRGQNAEAPAAVLLELADVHPAVRHRLGRRQLTTGPIASPPASARLLTAGGGRLGSLDATGSQQ